MTDTNRREFLKTTSAAVTGSLLAGLAAPAIATPPPEEPTMSNAAAAPVQPKPLSFDPAKLKGLSEKLIRSHWENNYGGSVKTLNAVRQKLADALAAPDTPAFVYGDLKREHLMRTGSVVFHELYFDNLGGDGKADAALRTTLAQSFGSFDVWETEFRKIAASLGGGSGWVVLGYGLHSGRIENFWLADHLHAPVATVPLLVMDMYEHSYAMDYGAAAARYVDAFFDNIRWETVGERVAKARAFAGASP